MRVKRDECSVTRQCEKEILACHSALVTCYLLLVHLAGAKIEGVSYVTPTVSPERGLSLVNPLMPAKSKRGPEARTCMPRRASPCDSVPSGAAPRVLTRPFTSPARLNCRLS